MTANPIDLVTIAQAYAWLGITPFSDDINMQFAVSAYSQLIASWCSRNFVSASYTEVYDGHNSPTLLLRNYPVTAVSSLSIDGVAITPAGAAPFGDGYTFDNVRTVAMQGCSQFNRGLQNISISYTAGYVTIPFDLQMACLNWLKSAYLARTRDGNVTSQRAGDTEQKYQAGGAVMALAGTIVPMPPDVYAVLSQYRDNLPV
jgi:hypothetical protein